MPQLTWMGKDKVKNHHHHVPFHLLDKLYDFQAAEGKPANRRDNLLIHGDNLLALKSLLPEFGGRVDCIYIDPPYNTGNEGWVYNDNVNDPRIQKWLGEVVGKEGEDLSRHDKWLCMMYPRLKLLKQLLADDGVIFISLDDNEQSHLKLICDEIFGSHNFQAQIIVQSNKRGQTYKQIAKTHEYLLCYQKSDLAELGEFETDGENLDKADQWGQYSERELRNRNPKFGKFNRPNLFYPIFVNPNVCDEDGNCPLSSERTSETIEVLPFNSQGVESCWRWGLDKLKTHIHSTKDVFARQTRDGQWRIFEKYRKGTVKAKSIWLENKYISEQGTTEFNKFGLEHPFDFPKPVDLVQDCLVLANNPNAIILDSFIGSGTTAHAVLNLNRKDGGNRRFIGIEMMDYAENVTAERIRRVINGYGSKAETQLGTGGGFAFYRVGDALFDAEHHLNPAAPVASVRRYIAYTEGLPVSALPETQPENGDGQPENPVSPYFLGAKDGTAYVFHYEPDRATDLSLAFLQTIRAETLPEKPERWVIYADRTLLSDEQMQRLNIVFKRIPRDISKL